MNLNLPMTVVNPYSKYQMGNIQESIAEEPEIISQDKNTKLVKKRYYRIIDNPNFNGYNEYSDYNAYDNGYNGCSCGQDFNIQMNGLNPINPTAPIPSLPQMNPQFMPFMPLPQYMFPSFSYIIKRKVKKNKKTQNLNSQKEAVAVENVQTTSTAANDYIQKYDKQGAENINVLEQRINDSLNKMNKVALISSSKKNEMFTPIKIGTTCANNIMNSNTKKTDRNNKGSDSDDERSVNSKLISKLFKEGDVDLNSNSNNLIEKVACLIKSKDESEQQKILENIVVKLNNNQKKNLQTLEQLVNSINSMKQLDLERDKINPPKQDPELDHVSPPSQNSHQDADDVNGPHESSQKLSENNSLQEKAIVSDSLRDLQNSPRNSIRAQKPQTVKMVSFSDLDSDLNSNLERGILFEFPEDVEADEGKETATVGRFGFDLEEMSEEEKEEEKDEEERERLNKTTEPNRPVISTQSQTGQNYVPLLNKDKNNGLYDYVIVRKYIINKEQNYDDFV